MIPMKISPRMLSLRPIPSLLVTSLMLLVMSPAAAQQTQDPGASGSASSPAAKTLSQQSLDQLLAPIALYPDPLLAQILMASTYPLEVVQAARWVKANPKITGKALEEAMAKQSWDPAVKSMTAVPQVLQQMNDKLDWTQKLGDAFLAQQQDVMNTVQSLRAKAYAAGNLKSSEQQVVKTETQGTQVIYVVQPAKTEVVYVPTYNPSVVYGTWWYSYPPYYMYPPAYVYPPGVAFATGVVVGAAIWGNCNWGYGHSNINVNVNNYNSYNKTTISNTSVSNTNWTHNAEHRRGVAYSDQTVAQQYRRDTTAQTTQARSAYRGYSASGATTGANELNGRAQSANQASASAAKDSYKGSSAATTINSRPESASSVQAGNRASDYANSTSFSGVENGASTREASQRGGASRRADRGSVGGGGNFSGGGNFGGGGGGHRGGGGIGRR